MKYAIPLFILLLCVPVVMADVCYDSVATMPVSCSEELTSDSGVGCRQIICGSKQVLACDKSAFFEMYNQGGPSSVEVCFGDVCMTNQGYVKSADYPICVSPPTECTDVDGDGYFAEGGTCGMLDCRDDNSAVNPADLEICNGIDDNCNGQIDERGICSVCGNGVVEETEICDDGNNQNGDGCSAICERESSQTCYDGVAAMPVSCSGTVTTDSGDSCRQIVCDEKQVLACDKSGFFEMYNQGGPSSVEVCFGDVCMTNQGYVKSPDFPICSGPPPSDPVCGNGAIDEGEQCDDGNAASGDGCSIMCKIEKQFDEESFIIVSSTGSDVNELTTYLLSNLPTTPYAVNGASQRTIGELAPSDLVETVTLVIYNDTALIVIDENAPVIDVIFGVDLALLLQMRNIAATAILNVDAPSELFISQQCFSSVFEMPLTCSGEITSDVLGGCRTIVCSGKQVLACDKNGNFEMYNQGGPSSVEVCFGDVCMTDQGYVKSPSFPICVESNQPSKVKLFLEEGGRVDWSKSAHGLIAYDAISNVWTKNTNVYLISPDGSGNRCITCDSVIPEGFIGQPAWHPDGKHLIIQAESEHSTHGLFNHMAWGINNDLWIIDVHGNAHKIWSSSLNHAALHPHFNEDGTKIIFSERIPTGVVLPQALGITPGGENQWDGWQMHIADFNLSTMTLSNHMILKPNGNGFYETHSLKNGEIVYSFTPNGKPYVDDIFKIQADPRATPQQLIDSPTTWDEHGAYSTQGLAFISSRAKEDWSYPGSTASTLETELYLLSNGELTQLTNFNAEETDPDRRYLTSDFDWDVSGRKLVVQVAPIDGFVTESPQLWMITLS